MYIKTTVFLLLAAMTGWVSLSMKRRADIERGWTKVPGTIVNGAVRFVSGDNPQIEYRYTYQDQVFTGTRILSHTVSMTWPETQELKDRKYPVGAQVDVYVNPENPQDSVLEPGGHSAPMRFVVAGGGVALIWAVASLWD